jgi:hypothetical protein
MVGEAETVATKSGGEASARALTVTYFRHFAAMDSREDVVTLHALARRILATTAPRKDLLPWLKLARFGNDRTQKGSLRHDANVLCITGVEADYDGELIPFTQAVEIAAQANIHGLLYTSPSHTEAKPRWRVLCPTCEEVEPQRRQHLMDRLNGAFRGIFSNESWTLSQAYYFGFVEGNAHHRVEVLEGTCIDLLHHLDSTLQGKPAKHRPLLEPSPPLIPSQHAQSGTPYGLKALESECHAVRSAPDGLKHHILNRAGYSIGGLVAAHQIEEGFALSQLHAALSAIGPRCADYQAAQHTLETAFQDGLADPRQVQARTWSSPKPSDPQSVKSAELRPPRQNEPLPYIVFADASANLDCADFVEGLLIEGAMSVLYGESNAGKTFFATDLAFHVAAGRPWRDRAVEQGAVLYLALEGSHGIKNRIAALKLELELGLEDANLPFAIIPIALDLLNPEADTEQLISTIRAVSIQFEMPVKLIVGDTLARAIAGGNENSPEDMGSLVRNGDRIRQATGAHLMWIHHSGKDQAKGARGHSSLRAATDTEIEVTNSSGARTATVTKQREMPGGDQLGFTLKVVELGTNRRGKPVTSCVVEQLEENMPGGTTRRLKLTGHKQRAMDVLQDLIATKGETSQAGVPAGIASVPDNWWRESFYERAMPGAAAGTRKTAFLRTSQELVNSHLVGMDRGRVWVV